MKYYIIAGEASGDLHAANCMKQVLKLDPSAQFAFTGGDLMEQVSGRKADIHIREMAFMGFVDVLKNIGAIRRNFAKVKKSILDFSPDILLLVDYPGFNLRMAKWAAGKGIRVDYYISPTVWAWKEGRVETIRRYTNRLFVILPFEEAFYARHQHQVYFVGHPLLDAVNEKKATLKSRSRFYEEHHLPDKPLIAVLPGSRQQEIDRMLDIMLAVAPRFSKWQFVVAGASTVARDNYKKLAAHNIPVVFDQTYELMTHAEAGIIKSGTSTLESALLRLPQVICYKGGALSFAIGKRVVDVKYIGLPNLILDRPAVKELIQEDLTAGNISKELDLLLNNEMHRKTILDAYDKVSRMLGGGGASEKVASMLVEDAQKK